MAAREARSSGAPEAFHVLGLIDLLVRDSAGNSLDRSVKALENAVRLSVHPTTALSDLSSAYLMRFDSKGDMNDLLAALDAVERANAGGKPTVSAQFTRAVVLQRLELVDQARDAWNAYLAADPDSPWAAEARRDLAALEPLATQGTAADDSGSVTEGAQVVRVLAMDSLLPAWGAATITGDTQGAAVTLGAAQRIGRQLLSHHGDESVAAMVDAILQANTPNRGRLARAHTAYGAGVRAFSGGDYATGRDAQREAMHHADASPILHGWARIAYVACVLHANTPAWSTAQFATISLATDRRRFPALAARAFWGLATSLNKAGRQVQALAAIRQAQRLYASINESENLGATMQIEALSRVELREGSDALDALRHALHHLRQHRSSVWLHNVLWAYARTASDAGFPLAALAFSNEGVRVADRRADPRVMTESRIARAKYAIAVRRSPTRDLDSAAVLLAAIPPGPAWEWQRADLLTLRHATDHEAARDTRSLDTVVTAFRRVGTPMKLVPALIARAGAEIRAAHPTDAARDLMEAASAIDRARRATVDSADIIRSSDGVRDAWRQLASLWIDVGQPARALAAIERSRSGRGSVAPIEARPRASALRQSLVMHVALLGDRIVTWTIVDGKTSFDVHRVTRAEWSARMTRLRARVELGLPASQLRAELSGLYDDVFRTPLRHGNSSMTALTIVGDDELTSLPLAAAYDTASRRYVIENYSLTFASDVGNGYAREPVSPIRWTVLAIGDPAFSLVMRPQLPRLAGARAEAADVRDGYASTTLLQDTSATTAVVRAALPRAAIFHFAGHAIFDARHPERSELVLAVGRSGGPDFLRASDIRTMPLGHVQLVVLSACETASTGAEQTGANGLVQAFLAGGARGVLGSMWKVDDGATRVLMSTFHRAYRSTYDASDALRRAQLAMLQSDPASIGSWSAFKYEVQ